MDPPGRRSFALRRLERTRIPGLTCLTSSVGRKCPEITSRNQEITRPWYFCQASRLFCYSPHFPDRRTVVKYPLQCRAIVRNSRSALRRGAGAGKICSCCLISLKLRWSRGGPGGIAREFDLGRPWTCVSDPRLHDGMPDQELLEIIVLFSDFLNMGMSDLTARSGMFLPRRVWVWFR